jgi:hypothetical protein
MIGARTHGDITSYRIAIFCILMIVLTYYVAKGVAEANPLGYAIACIPTALIVCMAFFRWNMISFYLLFTYNFFIMGLNRYVSIPVPISSVTDGFLSIIALLVIFNYYYENRSDWKRIPLVMLVAYLPWLGYSMTQILNDTTQSGVDYFAWYKEIRPFSFHIVYIIIIYMLLFDKFKKVRLYLLVWGAFILLAAFKGYWQKTHGFDHAETVWVMGRGYSTHILRTGIRYFSFFSDAATYGSNMAFSAATYAVAAFYIRGWKYKIFFLLVSMGAFYGMLISGTRSATFTFYAGIVTFCLLCKSVKIFLVIGTLFVVFIYALLCTPFGDMTPQLKRAKTAFDRNDASLNVRFDNQQNMLRYMRTAPYGIGLGRDGSNIAPTNKYWILATTAPDSTLVYIWTRTGKVGLVIFLFSYLMVLAIGAGIIFFGVKDKEIRGISTALICGAVGMLVAGYGNNIFFMYPNYILVYGALTMIYMAPHYDEEREDERLEKERKRKEEKPGAIPSFEVESFKNVFAHD